MPPPDKALTFDSTTTRHHLQHFCLCHLDLIHVWRIYHAGTFHFAAFVICDRWQSPRSAPLLPPVLTSAQFRRQIIADERSSTTTPRPSVASSFKRLWYSPAWHSMLPRFARYSAA
ncbi:hypothetical protein CH63R_13939 [Colletotrichum higginsianum IMI 349063]|uniref:Uncharacterized protein n=1 Tax=Colletotrichum higginsianum (strain IMI 349063) TaxID=759273 RepID=A0A1B7XSG6_COLHI|nr:hypothetical protein CH63R_13939 [Colletotrichum higginsianum IMI 349063]OBR02713.1 hypothetical protein CH63R_13939 [Colletotrichum higginsianum IMI 349063]